MHRNGCDLKCKFTWPKYLRGWIDELPKDMLSFIKLDSPLSLAAMAFSVVAGHVCC